MTTKKSFTVDRRTWYRGNYEEDSCLLRKDKDRCCLGFAAQQLYNLSDAETLNKLSPVSLKFSMKDFVTVVSYTFSDDSPTTRDIIAVNDNYGIERESLREEILTKLFEKLNIEVKFIN